MLLENNLLLNTKEPSAYAISRVSCRMKRVFGLIHRFIVCNPIDSIGGAEVSNR